MLHVSTRGEYGVRMMVDLARHYRDTPAGLRSLTDIAQSEGLPVQYLEQLIKKLREANLVSSTRGAHGGYTLTRPPEEISMLDVLRTLEGPIGLYSCISDDGTLAACDWDRLNSCSTRVLWSRLRHAIMQTLAEMTLGELVSASAQDLAAAFIPLQSIVAS